MVTEGGDVQQSIPLEAAQTLTVGLQQGPRMPATVVPGMAEEGQQTVAVPHQQVSGAGPSETGDVRAQAAAAGCCRFDNLGLAVFCLV